MSFRHAYAAPAIQDYETADSNRMALRYWIGLNAVDALMAMSVGGVLWGRGMFSALNKLNFAMAGVVIYNMLIITYSL